VLYGWVFWMLDRVLLWWSLSENLYELAKALKLIVRASLVF